jgi:phage recombination protein Bet
MTTALAVISEQTEWSPAQKSGLSALGIDTTKVAPEDLSVFLNVCQKTGLDPWSRQIYLIPRWDSKTSSYRTTIQTSIDGLRVIAQRSGEYAGQAGPQWCGRDEVWHDVWLSAEPPLAARVGVYRRGFVEALWGVARLDSYAPKRNGALSGLWATMPDVMLAKVAEALALRKAFPQDLSGLYTSDEMDQAQANPRPALPQADPAKEKANTEKADEFLPLVEAATTVETLREVWKQGKAEGVLEMHCSDGQTIQQHIQKHLDDVTVPVAEVVEPSVGITRADVVALSFEELEELFKAYELPWDPAMAHDDLVDLLCKGLSLE